MAIQGRPPPLAGAREIRCSAIISTMVPPVGAHDDFSGETVVEAIQENPQRLRKTLGIFAAAQGTRVSLRHTVVNEGEQPITLAPWALTVMRPEGLEIIPQPPLGEHPRDLLPNRGVVLWAYTDLSDLRLTLGTKFWLLRQAADYPPIKIGLAHRERWIAYVLSDSLFVKTFEYDPAAPYPDGGCNFETFCRFRDARDRISRSRGYLESGTGCKSSRDLASICV